MTHEAIRCAWIGHEHPGSVVAHFPAYPLETPGHWMRQAWNYKNPIGRPLLQSLSHHAAAVDIWIEDAGREFWRHAFREDKPMVTSLSMFSNYTSENTGQNELRTLAKKSPAAHRFLTLFGVPLETFIGYIREVYTPPKVEGVDFEFATGKRTAFLSLVDPSSIAGKIGPFTFRRPARGRLVPDDPGPSSPDRVWRRLASLASVGISYREPGLKPSLHIEIRKDGANVHVDREGFVVSKNGRITYDSKQVLNHLSADLVSDYVPLLSLTVKDNAGRTRSQANLAPWLEVNLPGTPEPGGSRRNTTEFIGGVRVFGRF